MELGINFVVTERVWTSFESNMNSSVPATAQCHYTQGCSRMKTQLLHEERHETVTQKPMKCVVNESEIDEPNVAMAA